MILGLMMKAVATPYLSTLAVLLALTGMCGHRLYAQQGDDKKQVPSGEPISPIDWVVTGDAKLDLPRVVMKQTPVTTRRLSLRELDSLNTLEKQSSMLLPAQEYPTAISQHHSFNGYVGGEVGMFTTPSVMAGYGGKLAGYSLFANGDFRNSQGHIENAEFTTAGAALNARYIAPDKYIVFGGSTTETNIAYRYKDYKLFASSPAPERSTNDLNATVDVQGVTASVPFTAGIHVQVFSMAQDTLSVQNNGIGGEVQAMTRVGDLDMGAAVSLDFSSLRGTAMNNLSATVLCNSGDSTYALHARAGFQTNTSSAAVARAAFLADARLDYFASPSITLSMNAFTGMTANSFASMSRMNPYINQQSDIDATRKNIALRLNTNYHPLKDFSLQAGVGYTLFGALPYFEADSVQSFLLRYGLASQIEGSIESRWNFRTNQALVAEYRLISSSLENGESTPFVLPHQVSLQLLSTWTQSLRTTVQLQYAAAQPTSIANESLASYAVLNVRGEYSISRAFIVTLRFDNLTNSSIFVWKGYRERGAFASAGIIWQF